MVKSAFISTAQLHQLAHLNFKLEATMIYGLWEWTLPQCTLIASGGRRCYPRSWCAKCRLGRSSQLSKVAARLSASLKSCGLEALSREAAGISLIGRGRSRDHRKVSPLVPLLRHGEWKADIHQLAKTGRLPVAGRWGKAAAGCAGGHWPC